MRPNMKVRNVGFRLHLRTVYQLASLIRRPEPDWSVPAERKRAALEHWERHGLDAAQREFNVNRSSLYRWRQRYRDGGMAALRDHSRAPQQRRSRRWPDAVKREIHRLRMEYPHLGPAKIHLLLEPFCFRNQLPCPSVRTIARLIADSPDRMVPKSEDPLFQEESPSRRRSGRRRSAGPLLRAITWPWLR